MIETEEITPGKLRGMEENELLSREEDAYTVLYKTGRGTVIKLYRGCLSDPEAAARDGETLRALARSRRRFPKRFIMPTRIFTLDREIVGYEMPFCEGRALSEALKSADTATAARWFCRIYKDILRLNPAFSFGDLHEDNVFISAKGELLHCDADGWRSRNGSGKRSRYLSMSGSLSDNYPQKYKRQENREYFFTDRNTDIYCLNVMVLNYLMQSGDWFVRLQSNDAFMYLEYLEAAGLAKGVVRMIKTLFEPGDNFFSARAVKSLPEDISRFSYESYVSSTARFSNDEQAREYLDRFAFKWSDEELLQQPRRQD